ncbi:MAG: glutamate racemase [Eubacteriales bacterium]|nr:glutamate racemase [Eubacteriales bacterium]
MNNIKRIGVFDSGLGGLTVLNQICKYNEGLDIVYFGDTARVPYGTRTNDTILAYAEQDVRFLKKQSVDAIIVACGTVSSIAIDDLASELDIPIYGVIEPAAEAALNATQTGRIGVIGTPATIRNGAYPKAIKAISASTECIGVPCPLLVPMIENGYEQDDELVEMACRRYLSSFDGSNVDTIIMGCTHYPFYESTLSRLAPHITFVDIGTALAKKLPQLLNLYKGEKTHVEYFVSDPDTGFQAVANRFLDSISARDISSVNIEMY